MRNLDARMDLTVIRGDGRGEDCNGHNSTAYSEHENKNGAPGFDPGAPLSKPVYLTISA